MLVYKATILPTGKSYVGMTTGTLNQRMKGHIYDSLKQSYVQKCYFHKAINKYGVDNIEWQIIQDNISDQEQLKKMQIFYIEKFATKSPNGYNLTIGGQGNKGYEHTPERRQKMRLAKLGNTLSEEHIKSISEANKGHPCSMETRQKISRSHMGIKPSEQTKQKIKIAKMNLSEEARNNISLSQTGQKNHNYGLPFSADHCQKISDSLKDRQFTQAHKANIKKARAFTSEQTRRLSSQSHKGLPSPRKGVILSEETKQKIRDKLKGKPLSEQTKQKMKQARLRRKMKRITQTNNNKGD